MLGCPPSRIAAGRPDGHAAVSRFTSKSPDFFLLRQGLHLQPRQVWNSQRSSCLNSPRAGMQAILCPFLGGAGLDPRIFASLHRPSSHFPRTVCPHLRDPVPLMTLSQFPTIPAFFLSEGYALWPLRAAQPMTKALSWKRGGAGGKGQNCHDFKASLDYRVQTAMIP